MTVYVHLYAIDAAGSLHTLGQKISSPRRADSEGAVGRGKRTGGKGGGDGGTAPRRAALDSDEAEMGSRAGDADGDRRVLRRGLGRPGRGARVRVYGVGVQRIGRLSSGTGVFFGSAALVLRAAGFGSHGCFPPPAASGGTGARQRGRVRSFFREALV